MPEAVVRLVAQDDEEFGFYRAMHYLTGALWAAGLADQAIQALLALSTGTTVAPATPAGGREDAGGGP